MSECPVHSSDDAETGRSGSASSIRWDLIFFTLAVGMLTLVLVVALQLP